MKKIFSLILAVIVCFSMCSVAFAVPSKYESLYDSFLAPASRAPFTQDAYIYGSKIVDGTSVGWNNYGMVYSDGVYTLAPEDNELYRMSAVSFREGLTPLSLSGYTRIEFDLLAYRGGLTASDVTTSYFLASDMRNVVVLYSGYLNQSPTVLMESGKVGGVYWSQNQDGSVHIMIDLYYSGIVDVLTISFNWLTGVAGQIYPWNPRLLNVDITTGNSSAGGNPSEGGTVSPPTPSDDWLNNQYSGAVSDEFNSSVSDTTSTIQQIEEFENNSFAELRRWNEDLNVSAFSLPLEFVPAINWVGGQFMNFFNALPVSLGDVLLFPLFLGLTLFLLGRSHLVLGGSNKKRSKDGDDG